MGASNSLPQLETVPKIDVPTMFGAWFVIATMPTIFEKGAHNAVETYSAGKGLHEVAVAFTYNKNSFDGPETSLPQSGTRWDGDQPSGWKVSPFWPIKAPYLVINKSPEPLTDENSWFVVGYPSRDYCWIMARKPEMAPETYEAICENLVKKHSYPKGLPNMIKVPQSWARSQSKATPIGWSKRHPK